MMDQQALINHITTMACSISLAGHRFINVEFQGIANQLLVSILLPSGKTDSTYAIELHEPGEQEVAKKRVLRLLLEAATHLEVIQRQTIAPKQRSFSL